MIEVALQLTPGRMLQPATPDDLEKLRAYEPNQVLRAKLTGHKRPRSVQQIRWLYAMFTLVADNSNDPEWDTVDKVKRRVKMMMGFFAERFVVEGKVYFELRSFAFSELEQNEATEWFNQARDICAQKLGVDPAVLEAQARELPF